jgi:hypothetical protein
MEWKDEKTKDSYFELQKDLTNFIQNYIDKNQKESFFKINVLFY